MIERGRSRRDTATVIAWIVCLSAVVTSLIAVPDVRIGPAAGDRVSSAVPPELFAIELVKVTALIIAAWLLLVTAASLLLDAFGCARAARTAVRLLPATIRVALRPALAATLTTSLVLSSMTGAGASEIEETTRAATLIHLGSTNEAERPEPTDQPKTAVLTHIDAEPSSQDSDEDDPQTGETVPTETTQPRPETETATARPAAPSEASDQKSSWSVEPGDHLWSISKRTVEDSLSRSATDREVADYWLRVIELNRSSLPDPTNPDLIYPGMQVALPPVDGSAPTAASATSPGGLRIEQFR